MPYLDNTALEMKERIMLIFHRFSAARTYQEVDREMERLEKLIDSFKNGIEKGKNPWTDKD